VEAILVSLVFDHALRIRNMSEAPDSVPSNYTSERPIAVTPDSASPAAPEGDAELHSVSGTTEDASLSEEPEGAASSTTKTGRVSTTNEPARQESQGKIDDRVGKINNLVTSDLQNLNEGLDFLQLGVSSSNRT
jgi:hypothetical protein